MGIAKRRRDKTLKGKSSIVRPKHKKKKIPQINSMVDLVSASFAGSRSMRNGYENVGIGFDPNASVANNAAKLSSTGAIPTLAELRSKDIDAAGMQVPADPEMADWKEVMEIPEIKPKGRNVFLAPMERAYWRKLVLKYGDDYAAMARDIKLNNYQHTQRVCEKKAIIYRQLYRDDLSRITPAPRRKEIRKAENKAKREAEAAAAGAKEEEEEDQIASLSEEELSEVSMSEDIEESIEEESSSEEEVPPPRKFKKPVAASSKGKLSKSPSRKHK